MRATHGDSYRKGHRNTNAHAMGPHALPKRAPYAHAHESMVTFMYNYRRARVRAAQVRFGLWWLDV